MTLKEPSKNIVIEKMIKAQKEFDLVDAVISDFQKYNSTDKECLYCGENARKGVSLKHIEEFKNATR